MPRRDAAVLVLIHPGTGERREEGRGRVLEDADRAPVARGARPHGIGQERERRSDRHAAGKVLDTDDFH